MPSVRHTGNACVAPQVPRFTTRAVFLPVWRCAHAASSRKTAGQALSTRDLADLARDVQTSGCHFSTRRSSMKTAQTLRIALMTAALAAAGGAHALDMGGGGFIKVADTSVRSDNSAAPPAKQCAGHARPYRR